MSGFTSSSLKAPETIARSSGRHVALPGGGAPLARPGEHGNAVGLSLLRCESGIKALHACSVGALFSRPSILHVLAQAFLRGGSRRRQTALPASVDARALSMQMAAPTQLDASDFSSVPLHSAPRAEAGAASPSDRFEIKVGFAMLWSGLANDKRMLEALRIRRGPYTKLF